MNPGHEIRSLDLKESRNERFLWMSSSGLGLDGLGGTLTSLECPPGHHHIEILPFFPVILRELKFV